MAIDEKSATEPEEVGLRAVESTAFAGVFQREATLFRRSWPATTFGSIVEPTINLIAFGFGLGALVASVQGIPYIQFVGTGTVARAFDQAPQHGRSPRRPNRCRPTPSRYCSTKSPAAWRYSAPTRRPRRRSRTRQAGHV